MLSLDELYHKISARAAWAQAFGYAIPATVLLVAMVAFNVRVVYWLPVLVIYAIAAFSHQLGYSSQALAVQIKVAADNVIEQTVKHPGDGKSN